MGKHVKPSEKKSIIPDSLKKLTDTIIKTGGGKKEPTGKLISSGFAGEIAIIVIAFALALVVRLLPIGGWVRFAAYIIPLALMGYPAFIKAVDEAANLELMKPEFIIALASLGAMGLQEYTEAVALLGFYRLCALLKDFVESRSRNISRKFTERWPDTAKVERGEEEETLSVKDVEVGETVIVEPGECVPLDGVVLEGITSLNSDNLTGDGPVIAAAPGSEVFSGCKNITRPIRVRVSRDRDQSAAHRLNDMVKNSAEEKTERLFILEKIGHLFTPVMAVIALILAVFPPLLDGEWGRWLHCAVIFLIASESISVLFSVPIIYRGGVFGSADAGIFIRHIEALERLPRTHTVVTEKTGIITDGEFIIDEVYTDGISESELLNIAAVVEKNAKHPIAETICQAGDSDSIPGEKVTDYSEVPGKGVCALVNGKKVLVGTASLLTDHNILYKVPNKPGAAIHVAIDNKYCGYFLISDRVRSFAFDAMEALRVQGVSNLVMLTGDVKSSARPIASSLNFDMVKFELSPAGKLSAVKYLMNTSQGRATLAFVGNGTDDGLVLECADVGISFDSLETYKAIDFADVIIMDDSIRKIPLALKITKYANSIAIQNVLAFIVVKLLILSLALAGVIGLWFAIAGEVILFCFSAINSARALKKWV